MLDGKMTSNGSVPANVWQLRKRYKDLTLRRSALTEELAAIDLEIGPAEEDWNQARGSISVDTLLERLEELEEQLAAARGGSAESMAGEGDGEAESHRRQHDAPRLFKAGFEIGVNHAKAGEPVNPPVQRGWKHKGYFYGRNSVENGDDRSVDECFAAARQDARNYLLLGADVAGARAIDGSGDPDDGELNEAESARHRDDSIPDAADIHDLAKDDGGRNAEFVA